MSKLSLPVLTAWCLMLCSPAYSQLKNTVTDRNTNPVNFLLDNQYQSDYRITGSTNSYLEIEFYPQ